MKRQDTRKKLMAADAEVFIFVFFWCQACLNFYSIIIVILQVLDTYRKMVAAKQKKRPLTKKEKEQMWKTLRDREAIVKQLDTGAPM